MAARNLSEALSNDLSGKVIVWGPAIAGAAILGAPVGIVLGLLASVALVASGGNDSPSPSGGERPAGGRK